MVLKMHNRNSAALDYRVAKERKKARIIRLPGKKARKLSNLRAQRMLMLGVFSVFCTCALGVSGFVMGQAKLTELTDKSCTACRELEQIQSLNTQLSSKLKSIGASIVSQNDNLAPIEIVAVSTRDAAKRS